LGREIESRKGKAFLKKEKKTLTKLWLT
jgi:hypothetical protein